MELLVRACCYFSAICGITVTISLLFYLLPLFYLSFFARPQDLHKRYNATWALVTGGSSGIGKAIVRRLAAQKINVAIVALDDTLMNTAMDELTTEFPDNQFIAIRVDLSRNPNVYMSTIRSATDTIPVSIVINNAGYLLMGFFHERNIDTHAGQIECNMQSAVRITHHFYSRMVTENRIGCIAFTSSAAFFMVRFTRISARKRIVLTICAQPAPFASMYGATKAFLSHFATSLAIEAQAHGIDVSVFHPSFTHTNLYAKTPKFGAINALARFGATPDYVADVILRGIGRVIVRDIGVYAIGTYILSNLVDPGALSKLIIPFRDSMAPPDIKNKDD